MSVYLVATVRITEAEPFARYAEAIKGLVAEFGGEPIVRGVVGEVLEGDSPVGERIIVTRFPDAGRAKAYVNSVSYQAARQLRAGAADVEVRLIAP